MPETGHPAPAFNLPDADMEMVGLNDFEGRRIILYFYPKDDTPGCTMEAIEFSDLEQEFTRLDAVVLGVSRDDCLVHAAFRDKHGLAVRLLSDPDGEACSSYGVWREKEKDGVKKMGIVRSTFIIDQRGVLRHALYGVNPRGHAAETLRLVKTLEQT
jgi:thioredoxin-dependent peroxiredoxin